MVWLYNQFFRIFNYFFFAFIEIDSFYVNRWDQEILEESLIAIVNYIG